MRFLSTRTHGVLDYTTGAFLLAAPLLFGFADGGTAMLLSMIAGALVVAMSLATDYECGVVPWLPMPVHLGADFALGLLLAVTPLALEFPARAWAPLLAVALLAITTSAVTQLAPTRTHHLRLGPTRRMP